METNETNYIFPPWDEGPPDDESDLPPLWFRRIYFELLWLSVGVGLMLFLVRWE